MTLRANAPVPSVPRPRAELAASPSSGRVDVAPSEAAEDSGTWLPATGGSLTFGFLGQPASSVAPASSNAIVITLFIEVSILRSEWHRSTAKGTDHEPVCVLCLRLRSER